METKELFNDLIEDIKSEDGWCSANIISLNQ